VTIAPLAGSITTVLALKENQLATGFARAARRKTNKDITNNVKK